MIRDQTKTEETTMSTHDYKTHHTQEQVKRLIRYDPETGAFTWLRREGKTRGEKIWNTRYAGKPAGSKKNNGYVELVLNYHRYLAHRVAWLYMTGAWPESLIDHIDNDPANNRWSNLRAATPSQNLSAHNVGKSGKGKWLRGVVRNAYGSFTARASFNGKAVHIGSYATAREAHDAYRIKCNEMKGEFSPYWGQDIPEPKKLTLSDRPTRREKRGLPRGVYKSRNRWGAQVFKDNVRYNAGTFETMEEAAEAARELRETLYNL